MGRRLIFKYSSSLDAVTVAWLSQLTTSFGSNPSAGYISALNTMIAGMRTDGDLLLLDRFWIFAQEVQGYSRVSIVNPSSTQITEVNSPTWTANQGYTGNGTTKYLNTNFNPNSAGVNYTLNNSSIGVYSRTNSNAFKVDMGIYGGSTISQVDLRDGGKFYGFLNDTLGLNGVVANSLGLFAVNRTTSVDLALYKNGSSVATSAIATTSSPVINLNYYVLARNDSGTASTFSDRQLSMAFAGGAINQTNFYNRFQTFATAIGF